MKFTVSGNECKQIISDYLQNKLNSGCEFVTSSEYDLTKDVTFIENTDAYKEQVAKELAEREAFMVKYNAEQAAKKAAAEAVTEAASRC